jgi:hypothetical protein
MKIQNILLLLLISCAIFSCSGEKEKKHLRLNRQKRILFSF